MSQRHPLNEPKATIDFESRSACDIARAGAWRYSLDPTTEVLCLAFRLPYWEPGRTGLWHPELPFLGLAEGELAGPSCWDDLAELFQWIAQDLPVEAHGVFFEVSVWANLMEAAGWPHINLSQWRCSAAKAATHSLPRALEDAGDALRLRAVKDMEGSKTMKKMAKPRKANKGDHVIWGRKHAPCSFCARTGRVESFKKDGNPTKKGARCPKCNGSGVSPGAQLPPMPLLYAESVELFRILCAYCRQDVLSEEELSERLPDLSDDELVVFQTDLAVNVRGFHLDREGITAALQVIDEECVDLNRELFALTDGRVERATQRDRMLDWLGDQGLNLDTTRAEVIDELLNGATWAGTPSPEALRGLELMRMLGRSSTAKFVAGEAVICPDDRAHGGLLYHGASTGRWTGKLVQPQNFPKGGIKDIEEAWRAIKSRNRDTIRNNIKNPKTGESYGDVMKVLSHALRGMIVAAPGNVLYVADYAAIEARVLLWLAEDDEALQVFYSGEDIYCALATTIFGYPCNKKDHPAERAIGKIAVLGLGYQMGAAKFVDTCAKGGVTIKEDHYCAECGKGTKHADHNPHSRQYGHAFVYEDHIDPNELTAVKIVDAYRTKFWRVKAFWQEVEEAAIEAVETREIVECGRITYYVTDGFLYCILPSGRRLAYPEPEVRPGTTPWGSACKKLSFMGVNPMNHQWQRQTAYGGLLTENIVQAIARDLMAAAFVRCERTETYTPVLTVHDELIAEAKQGTGDVKEFEHLMSTNPDWAEGCPVEAEGWCGTRYRK